MAMALRVSLCFFCYTHLWYQVSRTLLQYFQRYHLFSIFSIFSCKQYDMQTIWHHHWSNLHNRKTSISLKRKKISQKEKRHFSVFWKAFQMSRKYFSCHAHFNQAVPAKLLVWWLPWLVLEQIVYWSNLTPILSLLPFQHKGTFAFSITLHS